MKYNVLIFPASTEIANEIINSLRNHKYFKIHLATSELKSFCNYLNEEVYYLPYVNEDCFLSELNQLIERLQIDFIIPAHDDVAYILSFQKDNINAKIIGQSKEVNQIVRFKDRTYEYFKNVLPVPYVFEKEPNNEDFPVFTKPIKGQGSLNAVKINSLEEYEFFFKINDRQKFIVMEYLPGEEFTIDCFSKNGNIIFWGARTREKTTRGISIQSTFVNDYCLNRQFKKYAKIISKKLMMHGIFFFQMKFDKNNNLKLLEIGPRVSGTMMLNRVRGFNFVETALYQELGYNIDVISYEFEVSLARALVPFFKHNINYENIYIDFDDTILINEKYINPDIMRLIFQEKNKGKKVYLITKNKKRSLVNVLHKYGITNLFDSIIHIDENDIKANYMKERSLLIDDSYSERKLAKEKGCFAFDTNSIVLLFEANGGIKND